MELSKLETVTRNRQTMKGLSDVLFATLADDVGITGIPVSKRFMEFLRRPTGQNYHDLLNAMTEYYLLKLRE